MKNKLAFIIGSGPSIRNIDPETLRPYTTICINEAIAKFPNADYVFSCDARFTLRKAWLLLKGLGCKFGCAQGGSGFNSYQYARGVKYQDEITADRIISPKRKKTNNFGDDIDSLVWGMNSAHPATNFAYTLGHRVIVLLGCDCQLVEGKQYFYEFPNQPEGGLAKPEYKKCIRDEPFIGSESKTTWSNIVKANTDVKIINCSDGDIDGIDNMTLGEVIKQYG